MKTQKLHQYSTGVFLPIPDKQPQIPPVFPFMTLDRSKFEAFSLLHQLDNCKEVNFS